MPQAEAEARLYANCAQLMPARSLALARVRTMPVALYHLTVPNEQWLEVGYSPEQVASHLRFSTNAWTSLEDWTTNASGGQILPESLRVLPFVPFKPSPLAALPDDSLFKGQAYAKALRSLHDSGGMNTQAPCGVEPESQNGARGRFEYHRLPGGRYVQLSVWSKGKDVWIGSLVLNDVLGDKRDWFLNKDLKAQDRVRLLPLPLKSEMFKPSSEPDPTNLFGGAAQPPVAPKIKQTEARDATGGE